MVLPCHLFYEPSSCPFQHGLQGSVQLGRVMGPARVLPRGPGLPDDIASWKSCNNILLFSLLFHYTGNTRGRRQAWVTGLQAKSLTKAGLGLPAGEGRSGLPLFSTCLRDQVRVPGGQMGQLRWGDRKKSVSTLDSHGPSEDAAEGEGSVSEPTALAPAGPCFCSSMSPLTLYVSPSPSSNQVSI